MNHPTRATAQECQTADPTFQVVLKGVRPNVSPSDARAKLAALFKVTLEQIDNLLATPDCMVKRSISFDVASKYKNTIEDAGGSCELLKEEVPISLHMENLV